ncbi:MAG: hypothetical protein ACI4MS_01535 [Candidatus Coproplasma sp.]
MTKKKKLDLVSFILLVIMLASLVMCVVGVCIVWTKTTATILGGTQETTHTLSDWFEANKEEAISGFNASASFAILTVIFAGLTLIASVASKLTNAKWAKLAVAGCSVLLIAFAVVALITALSFAKGLANGNASIGGVSLASAQTVAGAGVWFVFIFGLVGGVAGLLSALKK